MIKLREAIEHTVLKPDTTIAHIEKVCKEAIQYHFAAVCIPPYFLSDAIDLLMETEIEVATVVGFPFGYNSTIAKFEETEYALLRGAHHIDAVTNIAAIKNNDWETVEDEIETLTKLVHTENRVIKIIAETGLLNEIEIELLCKIANDYKIDYMKTSTGVSKTGATVDVVKLLRKNLHPLIKIKASGGITSKEFALELIAAGADRLGTSSGVELVS
ncbi:MAG: deoxyribose-phosphate aldolase [Chitinophagales bacterium]|nr:deoxyribose-phosphate aldolase [Chitinophagales bacterium]